MTVRLLLASCLLASLGIARPCHANEAQSCEAAVAAMRVRAAALPSGDLSRRFAETDLNNALAELAAGDPEDCGELVGRARVIIETRPYALHPGEVLRGYGPDDALLPKAANAPAAAPR